MDNKRTIYDLGITDAVESSVTVWSDRIQLEHDDHNDDTRTQIVFANVYAFAQYVDSLVSVLNDIRGKGD